MLTQHVMEQAEEIHNAAKYTGKHIVALAGTSVGNVASTFLGINTPEKTLVENVIAISGQQNSNSGDFSLTERDAANTAIKCMGQIIRVARNDINVKCKAIFDVIDSNRVKNSLAQVGLDITIDSIEMPRLFLNQTFTTLTSPYVGTSSDFDQACHTNLATLNDYFTTEELAYLLRGISSGMDADIDELVNGDYSPLKTPSDFCSNNTDTRVCAMGFLYATGILNGSTDKCVGLISNTAMKLALTKLKAHCGKNVSLGITAWDLALKRGDIIATGRLLGHKSITKYNTVVIGKCYRDWLKGNNPNQSKGSVEALLGYHAYYMDTRSSLDQNALKNNPEHWVREYVIRSTQIKSLASINENRMVTDTVREFIAGDIHTGEHDNKPELHTNLENALKSITYDGKNLHPYVISVLCDTYVKDSDVKTFLFMVDRVLNDSDKPDMTHAIYIASVKLVCKWLASQVKVIPLSQAMA